VVHLRQSHAKNIRCDEEMAFWAALLKINLQLAMYCSIEACRVLIDGGRKCPKLSNQFQ